MKKVIFVGGTEFSGSTFFHMILANDPHGLAIGESHNFMRPSRAYHFNMHCSCGKHPCSIWQQLKETGEKNLYRELFRRFPEVDFIVDSSKNPFWIRDQMRNLTDQGIEAQNILVWKTPLEFAQSYHKRGSMETWERSWVIYHRLFNTLIDQWRAVPYRDLANDRQALSAACKYLSLEDFPGKERYWERPQHVVGGNPSARVHLYNEDNESFKENVRRSSSKIDVAGDGTHRRIYYEANIDPLVKQSLETSFASNPYITQIYDMLEAKDLRYFAENSALPENELGSRLSIPEPYVQLRLIKYRLVRQAARLRNSLSSI